MSDKTLTIVSDKDGTRLEMPVRSGTVGPDVVDIGALYKQLGVFTLDPGFVSTASCESAITYIDGDEGVLLYRGYPVDQLAERSSFLEVAYLLLNGELPTRAELEHFTHIIPTHTMINETLLRFFNGFHHNAHPMAMVSAVVGSMSAFYHDTTDIESARTARSSPTASSPRSRPSRRPPTSIPSASRSCIRATTWTTAATCCTCSSPCPASSTRIDPVAAEALDLLFILHADHEQNASTSTVRLAGSSGTNPYAAIAAGIAALWGPAHGGANEAVLNMLEQIGSVDNIPKFIAKAKDKDDPFRLMGFGHRVYKNFDPRAKIIRTMCHKVLDRLGHTDSPMFELALRLEEIALEDEYFVERKLYPNVDFYSGIIYRALGIPTSMFTVMFAIARTVGWVAHWQEMIVDPKRRIGRPRQLYTGAGNARLRADRASRQLSQGALRPPIRPAGARSRRAARAAWARQTPGTPAVAATRVPGTRWLPPRRRPGRIRSSGKRHARHAPGAGAARLPGSESPAPASGTRLVPAHRQRDAVTRRCAGWRCLSAPARRDAG